MQHKSKGQLKAFGYIQAWFTWSLTELANMRWPMSTVSEPMRWFRWPLSTVCRGGSTSAFRIFIWCPSSKELSLVYMDQMIPFPPFIITLCGKLVWGRRDELQSPQELHGQPESDLMSCFPSTYPTLFTAIPHQFLLLRRSLVWEPMIPYDMALPWSLYLQDSKNKLPHTEVIVLFSLP